MLDIPSGFMVAALVSVTLALLIQGRDAAKEAGGFAFRAILSRLLTNVLLLLVSALLLFAAGPGFRTQRLFEEHFQKHGAEFGAITAQEYLRLAQGLRDAPVGGSILQETRADRVFTKFDKAHGYFGAYNADGIIRTFFIPNDGERYFRRQARR